MIQKHLALVNIVLLALGAKARCIGIRIGDQDAFATARGGAFTATADNPSAIYYNPAGITQLEGLQVREGVYGIGIRVDMDPAHGAPIRNEKRLDFVPNFFCSWSPPAAPLSLGLGIYAPYGLGIEYSDSAVFRTEAKVGHIQYLTVNPVAAWQLTEALSIAGGATVNYVQVESRRGIFAEGDEFKLRGDGIAYGFTVGVLWQPRPKHSFGVKYHSATDVGLSGHTSFHTLGFEVPTPRGPLEVPENSGEEDASAEFHFPQFLVAGYSFRPTPAWNLEVNIDWTDWNSLNEVVVSQQHSQKLVLPFHWQSSLAYAFGVTRYLGREWRLSAGYLYSERTVPDAAFTPSAPDGSRHVLTAGLGQESGRFSWDLAYQFAHQTERSIRNGTVVDGDYRLQAHAISLSVGIRF